MPADHRLPIASALALALWLLPSAAGAATPGQACESKAATALRTCAKKLAKEHLTCLKRTATTCAPTDPRIVAAVGAVATRVQAACPDTATVTAAGYSPMLTPAGLVARLQEACGSAAASLIARSYGGPHVAVRAASASAEQKCLDYAYGKGSALIGYAFRQQSKCVLAAHAGKPCAPATVAAKLAARETKTVSDIAARCADLAALVAVDPSTFVARAADQAECLVASAHAQTAPLTLACGPRPGVPVPALATPTHVVLDGGVWGTRCGDGSDYAFWLQLAPAGQPVGRVVVFMEGGGQCVDGPDCASTPADLFEAQNDTFAQNGLMSSTAATNPFRDWTKVFVPYCTQDGHVGGGVVNAFPEKTVHRFGGLNVRATLRYVRDVLWASMDATDADGFRPDRLTVVFSGSSAGGGGAKYNYHYLLDDLRWIHTTLVVDSNLGLDNGAGATVAQGTLALMPTTPGWGAEPLGPGYCHDPTCAEGWNRFMLATSPRLKAVPEQQVLTISNQVDSTQRGVGQFNNMPHFVNTLRTKYCEQQGANGLRSFLSASSTPLHGHIFRNASYNGITIGATLMRDWLGQAMAAPDAVIDKVATGTIEQDYPGVAPFPCAVGSPSGAFL